MFFFLLFSFHIFPKGPLPFSHVHLETASWRQELVFPTVSNRKEECTSPWPIVSVMFWLIILANATNHTIFIHFLNLASHKSSPSSYVVQKRQITQLYC